MLLPLYSESVGQEGGGGEEEAETENEQRQQEIEGKNKKTVRTEEEQKEEGGRRNKGRDVKIVRTYHCCSVVAMLRSSARYLGWLRVIYYLLFCKYLSLLVIVRYYNTIYYY